MLTRSKLKQGEGSLEEYNPEIGLRCAFQRQAMESPREENPFESESDVWTSLFGDENHGGRII
jgi:hypothetical protein